MGIVKLKKESEIKKERRLKRRREPWMICTCDDVGGEGRTLDEWVLFSELVQSWQWDITFGPEIQAHLRLLQPMILEEGDSFGMKDGIFDGSMLGKLQLVQIYREVQGNQTRLLPVSKRKGMVCGGVPKLREIE